jgi:alkaline phosphatase
VVTNDAATGATAAACYAHSNDRSKHGEIFAQVFQPRFGDGVDVLIGAGRKSILEVTRALGREPEAALLGKGYQLYDSLDGLSSGAKRAVVLLDTGDFDLGAAVRRAIDILSRNPKGFFLMVESDLHTSQLKRGLDRTLVLDGIIAETAKRMKNDTLILFAADHSFDTRLRGGTKGQPILPAEAPGGLFSPPPAKSAIRVDGGHTGEEVLVAAQGPGAAGVHGFFPNTRLFGIMLAAYGW